MLVDDGIHLFKFWLNVGRAEQLRRFLARESDPLKQWKLSRIDVEGLRNGTTIPSPSARPCTAAILPRAPWTVIRSDDKRRARLNAIRSVLHGLDYARKNAKAIGRIDSEICGGPEIWDG